MLAAVRIVGLFLLILALSNLAAVFYTDPNTLISPVAVTVRYTLLAVAGIGFIFIRRWGVFVYLGALAFNWIAYFTVYGGEGSVGPIWLSIPIPLAICILSYFAWNRLK